jgi:hypothetical protein
MAATEDCRRPPTDWEHGNLPDLAAKAARPVLREEGEREERLRVSRSASGIASTEGESLDKIMIGATFSQGGGI